MGIFVFFTPRRRLFASWEIVLGNFRGADSIFRKSWSLIMIFKELLLEFILFFLFYLFLNIYDYSILEKKLTLTSNAHRMEVLRLAFHIKLLPKDTNPLLSRVQLSLSFQERDMQCCRRRISPRDYNRKHPPLTVQNQSTMHVRLYPALYFLINFVIFFFLDKLINNTWL